MKITSVDRNKKNRDRLSVYIDGRYAFTISEEDYLRLNLYEEREITPEEVDYIQTEVNFRLAKSAGVKYLSLRLRSAKEVYEKLSLEGFDHGTIEASIEELKSMGYINDKIFVQKYLFDRSKLKPKAKKMLKMELLAKGIQEDIIDEILGEWEADDYTVAENLARKKFGKYDLRDEKVIKKVYSFLQHRGFGYELVSEVISNLKRGTL